MYIYAQFHGVFECLGPSFHQVYPTEMTGPPRFRAWRCPGQVEGPAAGRNRAAPLGRLGMRREEMKVVLKGSKLFWCILAQSKEEEQSFWVVKCCEVLVLCGHPCVNGVSRAIEWSKGTSDP